MCAVLRQPKSVKLRALHSECKFGVAARSCQELLHKGCVRFQLPVSGSRLCLYEDGTEVTDDYFPGLPNDAELLLLTAGQTWQGYVSDITRFLSVFNEQHAGVIRAAQQLLSHERDPLRQKLLADLLHHVNQNITAETREQDPSWFEGLESRFRNKSGYLRYSCESRIRGYLRETRMPVRCRVEGRPSMVDGTCPYREHEVPLILPGGSNNPRQTGGLIEFTARVCRNKARRGSPFSLHGQAAETAGMGSPSPCEVRQLERQVSAHTCAVDAAAREEFERVLSSMCQKLKSQKYNGSYFDRGAEASERLCTPEGWFSCQGPFDLESCLSKHSINPYGNRESRILFSTWNLDHIIEKKRTVVPTLVEAIQDGREVNWEYFYSLLFTAKNLKLVHIACHKKTTHKLQCDRSKIYRPQAGSRKKRPARKRPPVTHPRPSEVMQR